MLYEDHIIPGTGKQKIAHLTIAMRSKCVDFELIYSSPTLGSTANIVVALRGTQRTESEILTSSDDSRHNISILPTPVFSVRGDAR